MQKKRKKEGLLTFWCFTWHWHNHVRTHQLVCLDIQTSQLLKGGNDQLVVDCDSSFIWLELFWKQEILEMCKIDKINSLVLEQQWQHHLRCEFHFWWTHVNLSTRGVECGWRKRMSLSSSHMEVDISCSGNKHVANHIMSIHAFIVIGAT
jgi:hypothetical protein